MINLKALRNELKNTFGLTDEELIINRKKKMVLVEQNGNIKRKRISYIKIEITE